MLGVIVNVITVIVGSCIGLLFKKGIPEKVSKAAMIESYIEDGAQGVHEHVFGKSITDPCLANS